MAKHKRNYILDTINPSSISNGKLGIRIWGTVAFKAGCLIKEFTFYSK